MNTRVIFAVIFGLLVASVAYYLWWGQRDNNSQSAANAQVQATGVDGSQAAPGLDTVAVASPGATVAVAPSRFSQDGVVSIDARLGQSQILTDGGSTQILLRAIAGAGQSQKVRLPLQVVLVLDRSGSMQGARMQNAQQAAVFFLDNLETGDSVAVVSYASNVRVDVPLQAITPATREHIRQIIYGISVGGGTCISCGLETAESLLAATKAEVASRVVLLSDGQANSGITDTDALATMARRMEQSGVTTSTIGVGLDYNEDLMAQVAISGNGNHYFVEDTAMLATVLQSELGTMQDVVARRVVATFTLGDGVAFVRGYDRNFDVVGNKVTVSLGDLPARSERTALFEVSYTAGSDGQRAVSDVLITYDEVGQQAERRHNGQLMAWATADATKAVASVDHDVAARFEQAVLADSLVKANEELRQGRVEEAERIMQDQLVRGRSANKVFKSDKLGASLEAFEEATVNVGKAKSEGAPAAARQTKGNAAIQRSLAY